jgi:hypothetical protein
MPYYRHYLAHRDLIQHRLPRLFHQPEAFNPEERWAVIGMLEVVRCSIR